eukprot:5962471-Pyramimonas_sp.AAC.1
MQAAPVARISGGASPSSSPSPFFLLASLLPPLSRVASMQYHWPPGSQDQFACCNFVFSCRPRFTARACL